MSYYFHDAAVHSGPGCPHYWGCTIKLRHTTLDTTPLNEWSAWRRVLYLTPRNSHSRQISIRLAGFKPANLAKEWPQIHALDHAATGTGSYFLYLSQVRRGELTSSLRFQWMSGWRTVTGMTFYAYNEPNKGLTAKGRGIIGQVHCFFSFSFPIPVL